MRTVTFATIIPLVVSACSVAHETTGTEPKVDTGASSSTEALATRQTLDGDAGAPSAPSTPDSGASNTGSAPDGGAPSMLPSQMNVGGPSANMGALPHGSAGSSDFQVRSTSEKPVPSDIGAFRIVCDFSHMNFDDPIAYPGQQGASHLHTFFGNTLTDAFSTATSIATSGNSTCRGGIANRTAYWVPALIDGQGNPVVPSDGMFYYKTGYNGIAAPDVRPMPSGLRMIAGDKESSSAQSIAYWSCAEFYIGHPGSIPSCGAGNHVVMTVVFPQCWDGVNLDSANHKSHMSYVVDGHCPSTHPVPIPEITFNINYKVPNDSVTASWRLASDMYDSSLPGGYSAHADWFDGWNQEIKEAWVHSCDNAQVDCHAHLLGDGRGLY